VNAWQKLGGCGAKPATHPITYDGVADRFGNDESKPNAMRPLIVHNVDNAVRCCVATTPTNRQAKIARTGNSVGLRQHRTGLRGKFGASLATTRAQNGATGTGTHAKTETVNLRTATVVWLKSSLAHSYISKAQLWQPGRIGRP